MGDLALIGLHDRLHAFRPAPTRLDVESPDRKPLELDDFDAVSEMLRDFDCSLSEGAMVSISGFQLSSERGQITGPSYRRNQGMVR